MLDFNKVSKCFTDPNGDTWAVRDVTFSLQAGEILALQGPSGSGKTTVLLMAGGLLKPTEGNITVHETDPYTMTIADRSSLIASEIGFVFQQFHLIPYLTVRGNILAPSGAHQKPGTTEDRVDELISHFKLEHRAGYRPFQLSTGERQRTALARAAYNQPSVILADEPTGNLDPVNTEIVLDYLRDYASKGGAILLVTHDAYATTRADRVMKLKGGREDLAE